METAGLWAATVGLGLLGNDERLFTGVGVQSMDRAMRVVGQGAAVPHRGLCYIQDLIAHCFLIVVNVRVEVVVRGVVEVGEFMKVPGEGEVQLRN